MAQTVTECVACIHSTDTMVAAARCQCWCCGSSQCIYVSTRSLSVYFEGTGI